MPTRTYALADRLASALTPVFGRSPTFISDSPEVVEWLRNENITAYYMSTDGLSQIPPKHAQAIVLLPTSDPVVSYYTLERYFRGARLLVVPLMAFDPSIEAAQYTLELVSQSDFHSAVVQNTQWLNVIASCNSPIAFLGNGTDLTCELRERVELMQPRTQVMLMPGEWDAIGNYFEVAMIPDNEDFFHPGYLVNGVLSVHGVAVARHRIMPDHLVHLHGEAWEMMRDFITNGSFPLQVHIENSRIIHAFVGNQDIASELLRLSNPKLENLLVEVAISSNPSLDVREFDWTINSVMNEGAKGMHVAVGDGVTGAHIDLLSTGIEIFNRGNR